MKEGHTQLNITIDDNDNLTQGNLGHGEMFGFVMMLCYVRTGICIWYGIARSVVMNTSFSNSVINYYL